MAGISKRVTLGVAGLACCMAITAGGVALVDGGDAAQAQESADATASAQAEDDGVTTVASNAGTDGEAGAASSAGAEGVAASLAYDRLSVDFSAVRAMTEDYWYGGGQIGYANPHSSHASNAYVCTDCHKTGEASVNQCNGCHNFETPEGWVDKDPTTTTYGVASEEAAY